MQFDVQIQREDGLAGDTMHIEAPSREAAEATALAAHPGWVIIK